MTHSRGHFVLSTPGLVNGQNPCHMWVSCLLPTDLSQAPILTTFFWHNMPAWRAKCQLTPHAFCCDCHGHVFWPCSCACHGEGGLVGGGQQKEVLPVNILCTPDHVGAKKNLSLLRLFCSFVLLGDTWMEFSRYYLLMVYVLYKMGTPNNFTFTKVFWNSSKKQNKTVLSLDNPTLG